MDAESIFYLSLILCSPLFYGLGRKVVALLAATFFHRDLSITAHFKDGSSKPIHVNLSDRTELHSLIKKIHENALEDSKTQREKGAQ